MDLGDLALICLALASGSFVKSITGMGLPLIAIPLISLFLSVEDAVVVVSIPNMLSNVSLAARERTEWRHTRDLPALLGFGVVGAAVGVVAFVELPSEPIVVGLALVVTAYVITFFRAPHFAMPPDRSRRLAPAVGTIAGIFQGAIGIAGPIVVPWVHSYRLTRGAHILTLTLVFGVTGLTQLVGFGIGGEFDGRLLAAMVGIVPTVAVIPLGVRLRDRLTSRGFDLAVIGVLAASVVGMLVKTFA